MSLRLDGIAPDFEQESSIDHIKFREWLGDSWGVLFSHPTDFTPAYTTELGLTAEFTGEFETRNVKTITLSVDSIGSHKESIKDIKEAQTAKSASLLADNDRKVSEICDVIHSNANETFTFRSLFVIDSKKSRQSSTTRSAPGATSMKVLRVTDSLQLTPITRSPLPE
jgi:alkyl hydroperoxide reductase subunit AhpC